MKLQPESKKELLRIACGVSLCTAVMWVVFAALHLVGWVVFDYRVLLGGIIGALVAIGNFAGICFVVQKIIDEPDEKRRKAKLQLSHNSRMLLQAVWVIVAIVVGGGFGGRQIELHFALPAHGAQVAGGGARQGPELALRGGCLGRRERPGAPGLDLHEAEDVFIPRDQVDLAEAALVAVGCQAVVSAPEIVGDQRLAPRSF